MLKFSTLIITISLFLSGCCSVSGKFYETKVGDVHKDTPKEDLILYGYSEFLQTGYKSQGNEEWLTYYDWTTYKLDEDLITFHLIDGKLVDWKKTYPKEK